MEASRRDGTDDWVLPEHSRPPSVKELEARIDVATSRARSAEAAAGAIGAAALDAAEQARRSAEAAERTHKLVDERLGPQGPAPSDPSTSSPQHFPDPPPPPAQRAPDPSATEQDPMRAFIARADRISLRLQRLQGTPLSAA